MYCSFAPETQEFIILFNQLPGKSLPIEKSSPWSFTSLPNNWRVHDTKWFDISTKSANLKQGCTPAFCVFLEASLKDPRYPQWSAADTSERKNFCGNQKTASELLR
jgi:hypothetical protein